MSYIRALLQVLEERILEKRKLIQVVVGPRQVGKTTLANQLVEKKIVFTNYVAVGSVAGADDDWLDQMWSNTRVTMKLQGETAGLLIIDEIQKIKNWSEVVKRNWEVDSRNKLNLQVIILGTSRFLMEQELTRSLLGKFELHYLSHWTLQEMQDAFGFTPEEYVWFGGYPGVADLTSDEERFKNYVRSNIIEPSISQDILMLTKVDKPALLQQLFELSGTYSGQIVSFNKMLGQLQNVGNTTTLAKYTKLLDQAGLLTGLDEYSGKTIKIRISSPKFQVYNTALQTALQTGDFAGALADSVQWGRLTESAIGGYLLNQAQSDIRLQVFYWREKDLEVDFVLKYGEKVLGIEVKSKYGEATNETLQAFQKKFRGAKTLTIGEDGVAWQDFLLTPVSKWFET